MAIELDLTDRTAVITGAGRGIGAVIATRFATAGANIVAAARTDSELAETIEHVKERDVEGLVVPTDLRNHDEIETLFDRTVEEFGTPEILINNAAANLPALPLEQTLEEVDEMLETNLRAVFLCSQAYARRFREAPAESGRIINISSVSAQVGIPAMTLYGGTNAGIYGVTRGFAADLANNGVTVNSVTPGLVRVERIERLIEDQGSEIYDFDRLPLGDLADPEDVANACLYLASDLAGYVTGEDLRVDGGVEFTAGLYK